MRLLLAGSSPPTSVHEDREPAGFVSGQQHQEKHAVEDQVRAHDVQQGSGPVEEVTLHQRERDR
jgi:hypothetical protein